MDFSSRGTYPAEQNLTQGADIASAFFGLAN